MYGPGDQVVHHFFCRFCSPQAARAFRFLHTIAWGWFAAIVAVFGQLSAQRFHLRLQRRYHLLLLVNDCWLLLKLSGQIPHKLDNFLRTTLKLWAHFKKMRKVAIISSSNSSRCRWLVNHNTFAMWDNPDARARCKCHLHATLPLSEMMQRRLPTPWLNFWSWYEKRYIGFWSYIQKAINL